MNILAKILTLLFFTVITQAFGQTKTGKQDKKITQTRISGKRENLIIALKKMQLDFSNKDEKAILEYFNFPLQDSTIAISEINSTFDKAKIENGGIVTKQMFEKHFTRIFNYFQMDEVGNTLRTLPLDKLRITDYLQKTILDKKLEISFFYTLTIKKDDIEIEIRSKSATKYQRGHPNDEDVGTEFSAFWTFMFDGQELFLKRQTTTG